MEFVGRVVSVLGVLIAAWATAARAQPPMARVISAGDALQITVVNHEEFSKIVVVSAEGRIHYPFLLDENIIGWRFNELEDRITRQLATVLKEAPYVIVDNAQYYSIRINILGQIERPGFIEVPHSIDLQGALWMAGGPSANADMTNVQIQRKTPDGGIELLTVNVERFLYEGRIADLVRMQEGDVIIVKGAPDRDKVKVFGEVSRNGSYVRPYGATVLDMIYLAGGTTASGTLSDVRWIRKKDDQRIEEKLDIAGLLRAGRTDEIPLVGQGDVIIVQKRLLTLVVVITTLSLLIQFLTLRELLRR